MKSTHFRIGNQVHYGEKIIKLSAKDLQWMEQQDAVPEDREQLYTPVRLTEDLMLEIRRRHAADYTPPEFKKTPPGPLQVENNYYSREVMQSYLLHLSPAYTQNPDGEKEINFWFCWLEKTGTASPNYFLPVTSIQQLKYLHQLQNLFFAIEEKEIFV